MNILTNFKKNLTIKKDFDYIIVGQGLAGTILHFELQNQNKRVLCIDNNHKNNSSIVAAGMYNPIVFKRLTKSWLADDLLPEAKNTYKNIETLLNKTIDTPIDIVRLFSSIVQQNDWLVRSGENGLETYLSNETTPLLTQNDIPKSFGYGIVKQSGWVNTFNLLTYYREFLIKEDLLLNAVFDYTKLVITPNNVVYNGITADKIIFCEGSKLSENPFFNYLPLKPTKGEVLTIEVENLVINKVLNKGFFILPIGNNKFRVGATYNWDDLTEKTTEEAKQELIEKIKTLLPHEFKIIDHQAGVRPTVKDRRPLIGVHPKHPNLTIFNGMGTKGVMIAPFFAKQFADFLINKSPISREVDIRRFK